MKPCTQARTAENVLICLCAGLSENDAEQIGVATGQSVRWAKTLLCAPGPSAATRALQQDHRLSCCGQDAAHVEALATDLGLISPAELDLPNIVVCAGISAALIPKLSAALTAAVMPAAATKAIDVTSEGVV